MSQISLRSIDRTQTTERPAALDRSSGTMSGRTVVRGDINARGRSSPTSSLAPTRALHARGVETTGSGPGADEALSPRVAPGGSEIGKLEQAARTSIVTAEVLVALNPSGKIAQSISIGENLSTALDEVMSTNLSSGEDFDDVVEALGGIQARARSESRDLKGSGIHEQALRADLDSIADSAGSALDELAEMIPSGGGDSVNPLSERAVFKSKSFTTEGAIRVIDQVLNDPVEGPKSDGSRDFLETAKAFLQERQAGMLTGKADTALDKASLQALMGSHGANKGLGKVHDDVKAEIAGRLSAMDRDAPDLRLDLPESLPGIREDGIMTMFLARAFETAGVSGPKDLERSLLKGRLDSINNQTWGRIDKQVEQRFATRTVQVDSSIAPQSQLGNVYGKMGGHGVNCHMAQSYEHVTNLAVTSAKVDNKVVFEGIRHGTLTAYKISSKELAKLSDAELTKMLKDLLPPNRTGDASIRTMMQMLRSKDGVLQKLGMKESSRKTLADELRGLATEKRAKDVITAALVKDPAKLALALQPLQDGEAPRAQINLNSISLLTPTWKKGGDANERRMWRDQLVAWDKMGAGPVTLTVRDANGQDVDVQVSVKVNAFNFGVNKGAVGLAGTGTSILNLASGWGVTERQNTKSMNALIGDKKARKGGELGGEVGAWLRQARAAPGGLAEVNKAAQVEALAQQIAKIWDDNGYRKEGREPYKIVSRLAVLTHMMGNDAVWNCKSGKDRTGECDTEAKYLATEIAVTNTVPEPDRKRTANEKSNFFKMAVGGGNHELQDLNTGAPGFKLKDLPVIGTLMGDGEKSPEWTEFLGLSAFYGS